MRRPTCTGWRRAALAAVALALGPAQPSAAPAAQPGQGSQVELLRDFTIALPPGRRPVVRLLVSPPPDEVLDRLGPSAPLFAVGPGDAVWLGLEPNLLVQAIAGYRIRPAVRLSDIAALDGGGLLAASDDALGFLVANAPSPAGAGTVTFQPIVGLPLAEARLAAGAGGAVYLFGSAPDGGGDAVFLLAPEPAGPGPAAPRALRTVRRVFATTERILAVAGDGESTYVAIGKLVLKLSGAGGATPILLHPKEPIVGLALTRRGLLFYATASGVGVVSPGGAVEFVRARNVALRAAGDDLYLLLRSSLAVVKIEGAEAFRVGPPSTSDRK